MVQYWHFLTRPGGCTGRIITIPIKGKNRSSVKSNERNIPPKFTPIVPQYARRTSRCKSTTSLAGMTQGASKRRSCLRLRRRIREVVGWRGVRWRCVFCKGALLRCFEGYTFEVGWSARRRRVIFNRWRCWRRGFSQATVVCAVALSFPHGVYFLCGSHGYYADEVFHGFLLWFH